MLHQILLVELQLVVAALIFLPDLLLGLEFMRVQCRLDFEEKGLGLGDCRCGVGLQGFEKGLSVCEHVINLPFDDLRQLLRFPQKLLLPFHSLWK